MSVTWGQPSLSNLEGIFDDVPFDTVGIIDMINMIMYFSSKKVASRRRGATSVVFSSQRQDVQEETRETGFTAAWQLMMKGNGQTHGTLSGHRQSRSKKKIKKNFDDGRVMMKTNYT